MTKTLPSSIPQIIALCGIKHCGKSTIAKQLALRLDYKLLDTDNRIEELHQIQFSQNRSCREIYHQGGIKLFQQLEYQCLETLPPLPCVISLGGGFCQNPMAWKKLTQLEPLIIFLDEKEERLFQRIQQGGVPPFLQGEDPQESFHQLYLHRREFYIQQAHLTLPPSPQEPTVEERFEEFWRYLSSYLKRSLQ